MYLLQNALILTASSIEIEWPKGNSLLKSFVSIFSESDFQNPSLLDGCWLTR